MATIQEKIAVMQHYANGGAVEWQYVNDPLFHDDTKGWNSMDKAVGTHVPDFNWTNFNYRIGKKKVKGWIAINPKPSPSNRSGVGLFHGTSPMYENNQNLKTQYISRGYIIKEIEIEV